MLPKSHRQVYQAFLSELFALQQQISADKLDLASLQQNWQQVQQFFSQQILTLTGEELEPAIAPRWRSLQTEIQRAWRLLGTDLMFLCASRQGVTSQARLVALGDRLAQLIGYCQRLIE